MALPFLTVRRGTLPLRTSFLVLLLLVMALFLPCPAVADPVPEPLPPGTVIVWGDANFAPPSLLTNVVQVSANLEFALALMADGTVTAWGNGGNGQTAVWPDLVGVRSIASGNYHGVALLEDGRVRAWGGWGAVGNPAEVPGGLSNVVAVASGGQTTFALKADGTVVGWGLNHFGQATIPVDLDQVIAVAAGQVHGVALRAGGEVVVWGRDSEEPLPDELFNIVAIAAGDEHSLALRADGIVVAWGNDDFGQCRVPPGSCGSRWKPSARHRPVTSGTARVGCCRDRRKRTSRWPGWGPASPAPTRPGWKTTSAVRSANRPSSPSVPRVR